MMVNGMKVIIRVCTIRHIDSLDKYTQENWVEHQEYGITWNDIERIAEQLKKGGEE